MDYQERIIKISQEFETILYDNVTASEFIMLENMYQPLILHPALLGIKLLFEKLKKLKNNDGKDNSTMNGTLPKILVINLDGFDNPINAQLLDDLPSVVYMSVFAEIIPDSADFLSFYQFLQNKE